MPPQPKTPPTGISISEQLKDTQDKTMDEEIIPVDQKRKKKRKNKDNPTNKEVERERGQQEDSEEEPPSEQKEKKTRKKKKKSERREVLIKDEGPKDSDLEASPDDEKRKLKKKMKTKKSNNEDISRESGNEGNSNAPTKKEEEEKSKKREMVNKDEILSDSDQEKGHEDRREKGDKKRKNKFEKEVSDSEEAPSDTYEKRKSRSADSVGTSNLVPKPSSVGPVFRGTSLPSSPSTSTLGGRTSLWSRTPSSRSRTGQDINYVFAEPLDKKYECPICCLVLRYPVQFEECGHRCCSSCLPELLRVAPRCPIDQRKVERDKVYIDKSFQKELDNLAVKCSNVEKGCSWADSLRNLSVHVDVCDFSPIECPNGCDVSFDRRFLHKHRTEDCIKRGIFCEFCDTEMARENEEEHLKVCEKFPVHCPNGCKKKQIPRFKLREHLEKECSKHKISCPFSEAGCDKKGTRKDMEKHMKEEPEVHLEMVSRALSSYRTTLDAHAQVIDNHSDRLINVEGKVESLEKLYGSQLVWKIDNYSEKLQDAKSGKKTTIFSPPFLTNRHGYKMALSACLYGDGKARGKSVSLFGCICKGEYDSLLIWPFCHRVTFTLVDQCQDPAARRSVSYTIKPNTCKENRPFLGRPVGERNASFGAQKFVELDLLPTRDFIRDDTIFIKVNVDSDNMQIV